MLKKWNSREHKLAAFDLLIARSKVDASESHTYFSLSSQFSFTMVSSDFVL